MAKTITAPNITGTAKGNNTWYIVFNKTQNGVQWKKRHTFKGTAREAQKFMDGFREKWETDMLKESNYGSLDISTATISDLLDYFVDGNDLFVPSDDRKLKTCKCDESMVKRLKEVCGKIKIYPGDTRPYFTKFHSDFKIVFKAWKREGVKAHMVNGGESKAYKTLSKTTIYERIKFLKRAFDQLISEDLIFKNPMDMETYKKIKPNKPRNGSFGENDNPTKLLNFIANYKPHIYFIVRYALQIPSRKSELNRLDIKYLDLPNRKLYIPVHKSKTGDVIIKDIPEDMVQYFNSIPKASKYVFYRKVGGTKRRPMVTYHPQGDFKKAFNWCREKAGFPTNVFHDTRHYSATELEDQGYKKQMILRNAGWKSDRMLNRYRTLRKLTKGDEGKILQLKGAISTMDYPKLGHPDTCPGHLDSKSKNEKRKIQKIPHSESE